jgi:cytolysin (calcineurin-like family phosphatase)
MKKVFLTLSVFALTLFTSCNNDSIEETVSNEAVSTSNTLANKTAAEGNYDPGDLKDVTILNAVDFPLTPEETEGVARAVGSRCATTNHFVGANTGTHWYHVNCGGTHYIIEYVPGSGWGTPWVEGSFDISIWHGGK